jgi:hypothetical protein
LRFGNVIRRPRDPTGGRIAPPARDAGAARPKAIANELEDSPAIHQKVDILRFEQRGANFALVRIQADGSRTEIVLTTTNVVHLSLLTPGFARQVLARKFGQRPSALGSRIGQAVTNTNLRVIEIFLAILDKGGGRFDFPATEKRARALASKLVERADRIAGVSPDDPRSTGKQPDRDKHRDKQRRVP